MLLKHLTNTIMDNAGGASSSYSKDINITLSWLSAIIIMNNIGY